MKIYVSGKGSLPGSGMAEQPYSTIDAAFAALNDCDCDAEILLDSGEYRTHGLRIEGKRSVRIAAMEGKKPVINGGIRLNTDLFQPVSEEEKSRLHEDAREHVLRCDLKALGITRDQYGEVNAVGSYHTADKYDNGRVGPIWCELFFNSRRMEIARYPSSCFLRSGAAIREGEGRESVIPVQRKRPPAEWAAARNPKGDIFEIDEDTSKRAAAWKTLEDVWLFGYPLYGWADASTTIASFDAQKHQIEDSYVSMFGLKDHFPYYFFNVFEELDTPGEWYLERGKGVLYLYPPESMEGADICLSLMTGALLSANDVDDLTIDGITFIGTRGNALELTGSHITVQNCLIKNVGGDAVHITGNGNLVTSCEITRTGRGGIRVEGGSRDTLSPAETVISGNHIHHIAEIYRTYQPGVGLYGCGIRCAHNCIHDSAHMAIFFSGNDHVIEYNEIYNVCMSTDDSSAIYAGRDYTTSGNTIRYNFFHDIRSDADDRIGIFGVYCDDNLGETAICGNVFLRCQAAVLLHGGHDMTFTGNLIVDACPKSKSSIRFQRYYYWDDLFPGGTHPARLAEVPYTGSIWRKRFPHIIEYLQWDPETEQSYPHYGRIAENIVICHKPIDIRFDPAEERLHTYVGNNLELDAYDGVSVDNEGSLTIDNVRLCALVKGFSPVPFGEMGLCR